MKRLDRLAVLMILALGGPISMVGQSSDGASSEHKQIIALVNRNAPQYQQVSKQIWDFAELGYHEQKSSALLQQQLRGAGFKIETPMPDMPTAFVASYGSGQPVIGILGEFDALPGLSQEASPDRKPVVDAAPGHACGHNLLGSAAALAAVSLKQHMESKHIAGTLRYYGTPAEEGGSGKVYMVRAGLFKDVDVVLHWHPSNQNGVNNGGALAVTSAKFTFHGAAAHAAMAPDRGRSALDGVMLMGNGVEFLREHVPANTRIHYIITKGGVAPNVVPDLAQVFLMARSPSGESLSEIWERVLKCARGAAMMTDTTVDVKIISSDANILPNGPLAALAQKEIEEVGGFTYSPAERQFAEELQKSLPSNAAGHFEKTSTIMPLRPADPNAPAASTDVGDVSWTVPTIGFHSATFVPGVAPHTWQAAATAGMSIGQEGMLISAKSLALMGADLYEHPEVIAAAKADLQSQLKSMTYRSAIPADQKPLLNYREE
jgi:aminobenzoyl-glutamate utilization protein B